MVGITPEVSAKRLRALKPIKLIVNPGLACGEGGEESAAAPPSRGASPVLGVLAGTRRGGHSQGAAPSHPPNYSWVLSRWGGYI